ncbi:Mismatch repair protein msh3, partial [Rhizopus stolonifer]
MKRQSSISSYFTKKPAEKKPRLEGICVNKSRSSQDLEKLHQQFREKLNTMAREKSQKHQDTIIQKQKLTPLEAQVAELKEKYPHCLLLIEVGYKFRFFGEDAKIASRILHIAHFIDRNFYVASIPVHRLNIHVKKLVNAGYRVGIVRQTETAALKAAGSNKSQPFARELDQMITKGTLVDDLLFDTTPTSSGGYLMCLVEEKRGGHASDERVLTGMVAVHPSTGDIIYDAFEDTYMRNELETRLLHIEP